LDAGTRAPPTRRQPGDPRSLDSVGTPPVLDSWGKQCSALHAAAKGARTAHGRRPREGSRASPYPSFAATPLGGGRMYLALRGEGGGGGGGARAPAAGGRRVGRTWQTYSPRHISHRDSRNEGSKCVGRRPRERTVLTTASLNSTKRFHPTGALPASAASRYSATWSREPGCSADS